MKYKLASFGARKKMKVILGVMIIILLSYCVNPKIKMNINGSQLTWSDLRPKGGNYDWDEAKTECAVLGMNLPTNGMRLPTREEGVAAVKAGIAKTWRENQKIAFLESHYYWTSDEYSDTEAYYFRKNGSTGTHDKSDRLGHVRCIR